MTTFEMLERWAQYTKFDPGDPVQFAHIGVHTQPQ